MNHKHTITIARDLATINHLAATEMFGAFIDGDAEAGHLAVELVGSGSARLELHTAFEPGSQPAHRLLLIPSDGDGEPVEVAVLGCQPTTPTPAGLEARFWFFGRLSHWQPKH